MSPPTALWFFVGFVALLYVCNAWLLRVLRNKYPDLFSSLGQPRFWELHSRNPNHWKKQASFMWFVIAGRGFNQTEGLSRALVLLSGLSYVGAFGSLALLIVHIAVHG